MDVVFLNAEFDDFPVFPFADCFEDSFQFAFHFVMIEYLASVFGCPDQMVFEVIETMG